jgi:hypothetical protein
MIVIVQANPKRSHPNLHDRPVTFGHVAELDQLRDISTAALTSQRSHQVDAAAFHVATRVERFRRCRRNAVRDRRHVAGFNLHIQANFAGPNLFRLHVQLQACLEHLNRALRDRCSGLIGDLVRADWNSQTPCHRDAFAVSDQEQGVGQELDP